MVMGVVAVVGAAGSAIQVRIAIDTGAQETQINKELWQELVAKGVLCGLAPTGNTVMTAGPDRNLQQQCVMGALTLSLLGHHYTLEQPSVLGIGPNIDILLGRDCLEAMGTLLDFQMRQTRRVVHSWAHERARALAQDGWQDEASRQCAVGKIEPQPSKANLSSYIGSESGQQLQAFMTRIAGGRYVMTDPGFYATQRPAPAAATRPPTANTDEFADMLAGRATQLARGRRSTTSRAAFWSFNVVGANIHVRAPNKERSNRRQRSHNLNIELRGHAQGVLPFRHQLRIPTVDNVLVAMSDATWGSNLDLVDGYWQMDLAIEPRAKSAFLRRRF